MPVAIAFAEQGEAARINYRIPLPGAQTGRRIIASDLEFDEDVFNDAARKAGQDLLEQAGVSRAQSGSVTVDERRARDFFIERMLQSGVAVDPSVIPTVGEAEELHAGNSPIAAVAREAMARPELLMRVRGESAAASPAAELPEAIQPPIRSDLFLTYVDYLRKLRDGVVAIPGATWSGKPTTSTPPEGDAEPQLFLVEYYGISSFLGDYGMGRTVKTFTLLPGESTTISLKTWQSSKQSIQESSSIIDSHEQSARDRFANTIQNETTDKATRSSTEKWHAEAEASASWGWGSAKVSGGASGEYQSGREQFAKQAGEAVQEHSAESSSKRQLSVSSASERTDESGTESMVERTISNANMRRVLNFVFRELNQSYATKIHLKEVRIGFTNGRLNSWREVSLPEMRRLLEEVVKEEYVERVAQRLLKAAGIVFDREDNAINVLERVRIVDNGTGIEAELAKTDETGEFPAPTEDTYYRFRRGPLGQKGEDNPVDGVLMSQLDLVMRTDSVIVEALLGQADALDEFAMEMQKAAAGERTLANEREQLLHQTLEKVEDPERRAELAAQLFGPGKDKPQ
ncbi:MAG TPA: hypothetical protein VFJ61_12625 [Solirubrobacterales bacterium]|nr:hypothetical protein [Solirubrobacterales bacterium]